MGSAPRGRTPRLDHPRRRTAALALASTLLVCTAPAPAGASEAVRVGVPRVPRSLDPWTATTASELAAMRLVYQGLVVVGARGEIEPALATAWSVSRDGLTWSFRLRPGVQLHDGSPLEPDDVVAALAARVSDEDAGDGSPAWVRPLRGPRRVVREVRRGDGRAVQVVLAQPYAPLLGLLAHPAFGIAVARGEGRWVGTGGYRPATLEEGRLVLETAPGWTGDPPKSPRVVLTETADDAAALAGLGPGGILDAALLGAPPGWAALGLQVVSAPTWRVGLLAIRTDRGLTSRKVVRQAVALALDPGLVHPTLGRWAIPATGWLPPGAWAGREGGAPPFDPVRARRLLAQVAPLDPTLVLLVSDQASGPESASLAEAIRLSLGAAGFRIQVRVESPEAAALAARQGTADLVLHEAALDVNDPDFFLRPLLATDGASPGVGTNVALLRSPLIDGMLTRASQLGFRPERARLYQRLQGLLADELPYVPLYVRLQWLAARPTVRGVELEPSGVLRLERLGVETGAAAAAPPPAPPRGPAAPPSRP